LGSLFTKAQIQDWICAMIILLPSLLPLHIWARKRVLGMPIWPVVAFLSFMVYGMPFLAGHPLTYMYETQEKVIAALTVGGVITITTLIWAKIGKVRPLRSIFGNIIREGASTRIFLIALAMGCAFQVNAVFWYVNIPSELFGVLRAIIFSTCTIA